MSPHRRALLAALAAQAAGVQAQSASPEADPPALGVSRRPLRFPEDFGAHPDTRIEWWYATGWLAGDAASPGRATHGFQVTFFRSRTGVAADHPSRFAARQLLFAHAALTEVAAGRLRHDQRVARAGFGLAEARLGDTDVVLGDWTFRRSAQRDGSRYNTALQSDDAGFAFEFALTTSQPLLLQGEAGYSRKGPQEAQASHYYSQPQLAVGGRLRLDGRWREVQGRAWLDHEWSDSLLDREAVGWDWIGMNLDDGSALTAFRLRRPDGSAVWAGGSFRPPGGAARAFGADEVQFQPGRTWQSPATQARYPVEWTVTTPVGRWQVVALADAQELDSRMSTGAVYWEGLSELRDAASGRRVGAGYLELTGYAERLRLR